MGSKHVADDSARQAQLIEKYSTLKTAWDHRMRELDATATKHDKGLHDQKVIASRKLISEAVGTDPHEIEDLLEVDPIFQGDEFSRSLVENLIEIVAEQGNRGLMVRLLSRRCPDRIWLQTGIEDFLIILHQKQFPDGTLVLCDAFNKAIDKDVRHTVAKALRRGFAFAGIQGQDDASFVSACHQWYLDNHAAYEPNDEYLTHLSMGFFPYSTEGVLRRKPSTTPDRQEDNSKKSAPNFR